MPQSLQVEDQNLLCSSKKKMEFFKNKSTEEERMNPRQRAGVAYFIGHSVTQNAPTTIPCECDLAFKALSVCPIDMENSFEKQMFWDKEV